MDITNQEEKDYIECEACGVKIKDNVAYYHRGKPSGMEFLAARVCQYTKRSGKEKLCSNPLFNTDKDYPDTYHEAVSELENRFKGLITDK